MVMATETGLHESHGLKVEQKKPKRIIHDSNHVKLKKQAQIQC